MGVKTPRTRTQIDARCKKCNRRVRFMQRRVGNRGQYTPAYFEEMDGQISSAELVQICQLRNSKGTEFECRFVRASELI